MGQRTTSKKWTTWRSETPWPILPIGAGVQCPKRGEGPITWGSCGDCRYNGGMAYTCGGYDAILCKHAGRLQAYLAYVKDLFRPEQLGF